MNKVIKVLACLFLVLVLLPEALTNPDISKYGPIADVNRDGIVDANDLSRLGQAYGSTGLVYEENKTVVTAFNETSPLEDVRIAIFSDGGAPDQIGYTDSSGITDFTVSPNTDYTAIACSQANYNYENFATNSFGEASVGILLDNETKRLPHNNIIIILVNRTSGALWLGTVLVKAHKISRVDYYDHPADEFHFVEKMPDRWNIAGPSSGIWRIATAYIRELHDPQSVLGLTCWRSGDIAGFSVFTPDESGSANVVIYID